jgi:ribosomal protein S18 acetylase RimI-like enzyme
MILVTKATIHDSEYLLALTLKQFEEHEIDTASQVLGSTIHEILSDEELGFFLLAWEDANAIGMAAVSITWVLEHGGKSAWLDELYVLPEHRGRGVGGQLLNKVLEYAQEMGCRAVDLEVEENHRRVEGLYSRSGFKRLKRNRWMKWL